jgi:hypothetical protein
VLKPQTCLNNAKNTNFEGGGEASRMNDKNFSLDDDVYMPNLNREKYYEKAGLPT